MKQKIIVLAVGLLFSACALPEENAPFTWHFKMGDDNQFQYIARGNVDYPANTKAGEDARINFLNDHLQRQGICPNGYDILSREPEHLSGRPDLNKERYCEIAYTGRCHSPL